MKKVSIHLDSQLLIETKWYPQVKSSCRSVSIYHSFQVLPLSSLLFSDHSAAAAAAAKSLQSCLILCDPIDGSPPGSTTPGILQARTLEWVAISFSNAWKWSRIRLLVTPWTAAYQAPPSMGFSRQEYWSGLPLPSPRPLYPYRKPQASG